MLSGSQLFELAGLDEPPDDERDVDRLAEIIRRGAQPPLGVSTRDRLRKWLREEFRRKRPSRVALYRYGMRRLCETCGGKTRWVQFSTSCVFHAVDILCLMPDAKIIFPLRNPYDIAGSMVARGASNRLLRGLLGWNRGVLRAERLSEAYPGRFRIVRYEDFVESPEEVLREIFDFVDLPYREDYLKVPQVNPAEAPHDLSGEPTRPGDSRVGLYEERLMPSTLTAASWLVDQALVNRHYPNLSVTGRRPLSGVVKLIRIVLSGLMELFKTHASMFVRRPRSTIHRIVHRLS